MLNLKWGIFPAAAGFALAMLLSLALGHTGFLVALLRAGIFGALFFGLGTGIWALINTFIPELLVPDSPESAGAGPFASAEAAGTRVNITVGDSHAALPDDDLGESGPEDVGNYNDLVTGAIAARKDVDQTRATGYTDISSDSGDEIEVEEFAPMFDDIKPEESMGDFSMDFGGFSSDSADGEGDSLMDSFAVFPGAGDSGIFDEPAKPERKPTGNKDKQLEGDFNAKEIAAGIRTVLEKDKKG